MNKLKCWREKRQARYGAKLPTSESPGDEVDRLDLKIINIFFPY